MANTDPSQPAATPGPVGLNKKGVRKRKLTGRHDAIVHLLSTVSADRDGYSFPNRGKAAK